MLFRSKSEMYTSSTFLDVTKNVCRKCYQKAEGKEYLKCGKCERIYYCSEECRKEDIVAHTDRCFSPRDFEKATRGRNCVIYKSMHSLDDNKKMREVVETIVNNHLNSKKPHKFVLPSRIRIRDNRRIRGSNKTMNLLELSTRVFPSIVEKILDIEPDPIIIGHMCYLNVSITSEYTKILNIMMKRGYGFSIPKDIFIWSCIVPSLLECGFNPNEFLIKDWTENIHSEYDRKILREAFDCGLVTEGIILEVLEKGLFDEYMKRTSKKPETRRLFMRETTLPECLIRMIMDYLCNEL